MAGAAVLVRSSQLVVSGGCPRIDQHHWQRTEPRQFPTVLVGPRPGNAPRSEDPLMADCVYATPSNVRGDESATNIVERPPP